MTTIQIIGIAVASLALLLLVIALAVTRRRGAKTDDEQHAGEQHANQQDAGEQHEGEQPSEISFLDGAPQDTLAGLGKAERPVRDAPTEPEQKDAASAPPPPEPNAERPRQPAGEGLDWSPDLTVQAVGTSSEQQASRADDDASITDEIKLEDTSAPADETSGPRLVPLSDIIVTTSGKLVNLDDPEVRRMLTELMTFEIDQAAELRRQGQTIDAILQLTEAEKISRALDMTESAEQIRAMMNEIRRES